MIMCVLLCYPVSIRIYYQQGVLFLVKIYKIPHNSDGFGCNTALKLVFKTLYQW